jgi:hypothetical protein
MMLFQARILRKAKTAWRLPWQEKIWLGLLYPLSGLARAALLCIPFRRVAPYLGRHHGNLQLSPLATPGQIRLAARIGSISAIAARFTPWKSRCLVQAIMVKTLLAHYGIPHVIYLGVVKPTGPANLPADFSGSEHPPGMKAHAWVAVGPKVVAGRAGHRTFTIVSTFASPASLSRVPAGS